MIGFHNVRFPEDVSWGSSGGPRFKTQVYESFRGFEKRNIDWAQPMMEFDVQYGIKTDVQMLRVLEFFNARQGRAHGFRFKHWPNYRIQNGPIATGDGVSTRLPLWKFYGFQGARMYKRLRKIVPGSVVNVGVGAVGGLTEGVDFNIDYDAGEIALNFAPGYGFPVYAENLEFDEPVRFDTDSLQAIIDGFNNQSLSSLPLVGIKSGFTTGSVFAPNADADGQDDFFESVRAVLNFDDIADTSTTIDQSELALPVVLNGDASLDATTFKHGMGSLTPGDTGYLSMTGDPFSARGQPFTIEAFLQQPTVGAAVQPIMGKWNEVAGQKCWTLRFLQATRQLQFVLTEDGSTENIILNYPWTTAQTGLFDYITVDRLPSGWYVLRINGVVQQSAKFGGLIYDTSVPFHVGGYPTLGGGQSSYQAQMDAIRVTMGRTRHAGFETIDIPAPYPV